MMGNIETVIGKKIREIRLNAQLTQEGFAELIEVHHSYIGPIEKGRKRPSIRTLKRISETFHTPLYEFFLNGDAMAQGPLLELNLLLSAHDKDAQCTVLAIAKSLLRSMEQATEPSSADAAVDARRTRVMHAVQGA